MYFFTLIFLLLAIKSVTYVWLHKPAGYLTGVTDSITFGFFIFLQQVALFLIWSVLLVQFGLALQLLFSGILFALLHTHLFFKLRSIDALLLTASSFLGGVLFAYLYGVFSFGLLLAIIIHIVFHVVLDIYFAVRWGRPMKSLLPESSEQTRSSN